MWSRKNPVKTKKRIIRFEKKFWKKEAIKKQNLEKGTNKTGKQKL